MTTDNEPLVAGLVKASVVAEYRRVTDQLIEDLQGQLADRDAELAAIKAGVERLIFGRSMPTTNELAKALYPTSEAIAQFRRADAS